MTFFQIKNRRFSRAKVGTLLMFLLACVSTLTANASTKTRQSGRVIVFDAQLQVNDKLWPASFQTIRVNLAAGGDESSKGIVPDRSSALILRKNPVPETAFEFILRVRFLGRYDVASAGYYPLPNGPLGWIRIVSGHTQPFISINCTRLAQ
jgi:hypothetical protein